MSVENKQEETVEEKLLDFDKMYFMNFSKYAKVMGKLTLFAIIGVIFINVMLQGIPIWIKCIFGVAMLFLGVLIYYDIKYMIGLKRNPFMIFPEKKIFRYYNEFQGNTEIDITKIEHIKIYSRPNEPYLLEIFLKDTEKEENVNIVGFDTETINEILNDIISFNKEIEVTSKLTKKETKKEKLKK